MLSLFLVLACADPLPDLTSLVTEPRVLAVTVNRVDPKADASLIQPAEAAAGEAVALSALYADETGALGEAPVDWSFCVATKPLAELGLISASCLDAESEDLATIGTGLDSEGVVPLDTCSLFGPNPPPAEEGQPAGRPQDPDITGGYYQPAVGFEEGTLSSLVPVRIRCGIANVAQETYVEWNQRYHSNQNPAEPDVGFDGNAVEGAAVAPGDSVTLLASWPACPENSVCGDDVCSADEDLVSCSADCTEPHGCGGAETYVVYEDGELTTRREAISATWFATGGTFENARNGRSGDDMGTSVDNGWTAPDTAGEVWVAVVLRDERGGVSFRGFLIEVQ